MSLDRKNEGEIILEMDILVTYVWFIRRMLVHVLIVKLEWSIGRDSSLASYCSLWHRGCSVSYSLGKGLAYIFWLALVIEGRSNGR